MITLDIPSIIVNQFDKERYTLIEQSILKTQTDVADMKVLLQEVLTSRQADVDAATMELKKHNDALQQVIDAFKAKM